MADTLTIGQLAKVTGVPAKTIRHYEAVGALPHPQRSGAGYRLYTGADVRRLEIIRGARALDMSLPGAAELVRWSWCGGQAARIAAIFRKVSMKWFAVSWGMWTGG